MEAEPFFPPAPTTGLETEVLKISNLSTPNSGFLFQRPLVGATLLNLGNTCFMNAVLQCITHTVPLVEKLRSNSHSPACSDYDDEFCSFCALRDHVDRCITMSGSVVSPRNFAYNINKISSYFEPGEQQDAHEFLGYFLDSIDKSFLKHSYRDQHSACSEGDSPVIQVFRGRLRSQLQCSDCGHCSDTYEHLLDLSLEIEDVETLTDALESFTRKEKIDDIDAKFTCDGCKARVSMEKQLKIDQPPIVIALHLKRFKHTGLFTHKICKFVNYPLELDLRPYMSCPGEDEPSVYDLYAIVVHDGSCYSGHYYCNIRTSPVTWHQMNDSLKAKISESTVLDQEAYILFYIKKGSCPWFTSLMEVERVSQPDSSGSPSSVLDHEDSDLASSSGGEACCSGSRQTLAKDEGPGSHSATPVALPASGEPRQQDNPASVYTFPEISWHQPPADRPTNAPPTQELSADQVQTVRPAVPSRLPDRLSNMSVSTAGTATSRFLTKPTKRPASDHHIIDVFTDEPLEDDKENQVTLQNRVGSTVGGSKEAGKYMFNSVQDAELRPLRTLVKGMHSSRRSSILACLNGSAETSGKRIQTSKSDPPLNKRKRVISDLHISGGTGGLHCRSTNERSLSPHSIKRGLFADDQDFMFEF